MDNSPASPLFVILFFLLRCLLPIIILMGISYILRKLGLVSESHKSPPNDPGNVQNTIDQGGLQHGKT
jgi:hypothetical protein